MATKQPEIQADALLNLVLDEQKLQAQLKKALGTTVAEAASAANLGDKLVSPKELKRIRTQLQNTFQDAAKDLGEALNIAQSDGLKKLLEKTRRDTVKGFKADVDTLLSGKASRATKGRAALPAAGELADELRQALRVFGRESLRSGSYQTREPELRRAESNVAQLNKVISQLAGLPAVAAEDLRKLRSIVNDKDTGRYLKMQADERKSLAKSGQALVLQTQTLERLAGTLTKMGFGDAAAEIKAANQARKQLVGEFTRVTSPAAVQARARLEEVARTKVEGINAKRDRKALADEIKQRERDQRAQGTYQTIFGPRRAGQPSRGILATMDSAARASGGYKPREDYRAASLATISSRNAQEAANQLKQQEQINRSQRQAEERQQASRAQYLQTQEKLQNKEADLQRDQAKAVNEAQQKARVQSGRQNSSYGDAQRVLQMLGGYGGLRDDMDIGIVRGGLTSAYRNAQQRVGVASSVQGTESPQYREALADLNRIRGERDQLAARIGAVRAERRAETAAARGGSGGPDSSDRLLGQFGRYAIGYGALYQMLGLVTQLKTELIELDRAFYSIKAVTQASDREMRSISRSIREVALNTNFSSREIANAAELLGQAGVAPGAMDSVLASTAQFASATNSPLTVAADLLTTVRTVFKEMEDSTIADQLTKAINLSKLSAEDLKTILSLTSQTAASYNVDLEQLLGAVTTLRNAGIKPSTVATGLRQAMLEVFNPDAATLKALGKRYQEIGENMGADQIRQRFFGFTNAENPLIAALGELRRLGLADEGQKTLQRGFDIRAFNAISGLIQNFQELEAAESKITFGRAAVEGANIQLESLSATLENLGSSVVVLSEQLSRGLVRDLQNVAQAATDAIESLTDLDLELKAKGEGGLADIAGAGFAGGIAGAILGRGAKGKIAGAALGAFGAGAAASASQAGDGELGIGDAVEIAGVVTFVGGIIAGLARRLRVFKKVGDVISKVPGANALLKADDAAEAGGKLGAIASVLSVVGAVLYVFEKVIDLIPESEVERLRGMADAAAEKAASAREKLTKLEDDLRQYDVNSEDPAAGTFPATLAKYRESLANVNLRMDQALGTLADDKRAEVEAILAQYAEAPGSVRSQLLAQLEQLTGKTLDDKTIYEIASAQERLVQTVQGMRESIARRLQLDVEEAAVARGNGDPIDANISARLAAADQMGPEFDKIIGGYSDLDFTEQQRILEEYTGKVFEILDTRPKLAADLKAAQITDLSASLAASLSAADNSAEISILVASIANGVTSIGLNVEQRLQGIMAGLGANSTRINARLEEIAEERKGPSKLPGLYGALENFVRPLSPERKAALDAEETNLREQLVANEAAGQAQMDAAAQSLVKQREEAAKRTAQMRRNSAASVAEFQNNADYQRALGNPSALTEMGLSPLDQQFLLQNRDALTAGGDASKLFAALDRVTEKDGQVTGSKEFQQFANIAKIFGANAERTSKEQLRKERDERNLITGDQLAAKTRAETAIKKADYGKEYGLLTSDSPDNPVRQLFSAQRILLQKELEQLKAEASDADEDGSKTAVDKRQKVIEAEAKLETLDMEMEQELDKFRARAKTSGEQAQRKADNDAKKQARIAVTQTGIEQRIIKQDFDEAIRLGDEAAFKAKSDEYIAVQEKLRTQLEDELKARGYNASQILDEIKLREDLNKPLAEQVENIRKLAAQQKQMRDLEFRDIGSGPNLGGKENTAYLGAQGFTREELAAAGLRDVYRLRQRRDQVAGSLNSPAFQGDAETLATLNAELEELDSNIGAARADLEQLTMSADQSIYEAFSPRNLIIELENTQFSYQNIGDNLRSGLVSALDDAGDALARMVREGGDFKDVLSDIVLSFAQEELAMLFKTNLRELSSGLVKGASGEDGSGGGLGGVAGAIGNWADQLFSFDGGPQTPGAPGSPAAEGGEGGSLLGALFGGGAGGEGGAAGTMTVQAGVVNVVGGGTDALEQAAATLSKDVPKAVGQGVKSESRGFFASIGDGISNIWSSLFGGGSAGGGSSAGGLFSSLGGLFGGSGTDGKAIGAAAQTYGPEVAKMGGVTGGGAGSVSSAFTNVGGGNGFGGAFSGAGIGAALGGAVGGKSGSKWGALAGALIGAYFGVPMGGFAMAGGGRITKSGMVVGPGRRGVDSVPVTVKGTGENGLLAPGESVLNMKATDALGENWVDAANSGKLFRKAVGGVVDASYNATQRAQSTAAHSMSAAAAPGVPGAPQVNLKNVNVFDKDEIRAAFQNRDGEDVLINTLRRRGAIK